jgi:hypothetical protein
MGGPSRYADKELQYLYKRAKQGATTMDLGVPTEEEGLSDEEVERLVDDLERSDDPLRQSKILGILEYAGAEDFRKLEDDLRQFLGGPNSWLARKALTILCESWELASEYGEQLRTFMRGVAWDDRTMCQAEAIRLAGEYLAARERRRVLDPGDLQLLEELIQTYEREAEVDGRRMEAFNAMYHIVGEPDASDTDVIERAKNLLLEKGQV